MSTKQTFRQAKTYVASRTFMQTDPKNRKTIAKMLKHALPPGYRRTGLPNRPSPGPYIGVIDEILSTDKAEFPNLRSCQSLPKTSA